MDRRRVGYFESMCIYLHEYAMGSGTLVTLADIEGHIDPDMMLEAVHDLYIRHPLLHSVIKEEEGDFFFEASASDKDLRIEFTDKKISREIMIEKELNTMLNPSKALWRMTFMIDSRKKHPIHTIILTCHHAIGDGISSMSLIKELMRSYEKIEKGVIVDAKPLPFLDSVEEMALSHKKLDSYISHIEMLSKKCEGAIAIERSAPLQHRKSKVLFVDFSPSEVEAMHRVAKLEKVTLNQVLMAAYAFSLQDVFKKPLKAPIYTPVDMRQRLIPTIDPSHFGMYVSYILNVMEIDRNKNSFFEFARRYKEEFEKELGFQGHPPLVTGKTTRQLFDDFEKQHLEAFDAGLSLNNLGKLPFSKEFHRHRIDAIYFSQTRKAGDFPIVHHTVTLDGAMHLCIVYVEPLMSHATATGVMNAFIHELEKHCGFSHKSDLESRKAS